MDNPLVTVGIPTFNCERFILKTIKSVLNQTYTNFELIITDDGSHDNTINIIKQFNDHRITIIHDSENKGISYRLNQQIHLAQGKYFCRMDGDDIMFPDRLKRQVEYLESHADVDVVGSSAVIIDDDDKIIGTRMYKENSNDRICSGFIHPTVLGKLSFFRKQYYRDEVTGVEDIDLWIRSSTHYKFVCLNEPTLFYREPLIFKTKTYLFRQVQYRKALLLWFKESKIAFVFFIRSYILTYFKSRIALILHFFSKDLLMISRRNDCCNPEMRAKMEKILKLILTDTGSKSMLDKQ